MTLIDRLADDTGTRVALTNGVDLGSDTYDDRGGTVEGDDGTDRFLPGLGEEIIDGGAGWDTLDFRGSDGLRVSLLDNSGTGRAAGDRYNGIEVVRGRGAVWTRSGGLHDNTFYGLDDDDQLDGFAGNDSLIGRAGRDTLTGGLRDDRFVFGPLADAGDRIRDFGQGDDVLVVSSSGFGLGLAEDMLDAYRLCIRADNLAQDADDRFVLRTTD